MIKGQLFLANSENHVALPTWVNTQRRLGLWGCAPKKEFYRLQRHEWICPNPRQSSPNTKWWCNGLYHNTHSQQFYMYRQPHIFLANLSR